MRVGTYVLPGDPVWLRSSLCRYYPVLDDLVAPTPSDGIGWAGRPIPVAEVLAIVREVDTRGLLRVVPGAWTDRAHPMAADTAQRQSGVDALADIDWVMQIDNDELMPDVAEFRAWIQTAEDEGFDALEWPMRVLFRHLGGEQFLAVSDGGRPVYEYPGPVAVRANSRLTHARRTSGRRLRLAVVGDDRSMQLSQPDPAGSETRYVLTPEQAILHNSWARAPKDVWRKTRTWGHASGLTGARYYATVWWPSRVTHRWMRQFHPFMPALWPGLQPVTVPDALLADTDRQP